MQAFDKENFYARHKRHIPEPEKGKLLPNRFYLFSFEVNQRDEKDGPATDESNEIQRENKNKNKSYAKAQRQNINKQMKLKTKPK